MIGNLEEVSLFISLPSSISQLVMIDVVEVQSLLDLFLVEAFYMFYLASMLICEL